MLPHMRLWENFNTNPDSFNVILPARSFCKTANTWLYDYISLLHTSVPFDIMGSHDKTSFYFATSVVMLLACYMSLNLPGLHHANIASHRTGWLSSVAAYIRRFCYSVNLIKTTCKDDAITSRCPPLNCCRAQWYRWLACNASVSNTSILNFKFATSQTQRPQNLNYKCKTFCRCAHSKVIEISGNSDKVQL